MIAANSQDRKTIEVSTALEFQKAVGNFTNRYMAVHFSQYTLSLDLLIIFTHSSGFLEPMSFRLVGFRGGFV